MGTEHISQVLVGKNEYVYVGDNNTGVMRTVIGPCKFTPEAHETVSDKRVFIRLNAGQWVVVTNPAQVDDSGQTIEDSRGQVETAVGLRELRAGPTQFPIFPGEEIGDISEEYVLGVNQALRLRAKTEFMEETGVKRAPGDEWLHTGPRKYIPPIEVEVADDKVSSFTVPGAYYTVLANPFDASEGVNRLGERKVVSGPAVFFLHPGEAIEPNKNNEELRPKKVLGRSDGLYIQAVNDHSDSQDGEGEAPVARHEGETWLVRGPRTYVPNKDVQILGKAVALSLGEGEGAYIKNWRSGEVRLESGPREIMLEPHEKLFEKKLSRIEEITISMGSFSAARMRKDENYMASIMDQNDVAIREHNWQAVVMRLPDNSIGKINNYKENRCRIVYGPTTTMLGPWEEVSILELSAGSPKRPKELYIAAKTLGPDFMSDEIEASTSDHTRLRIRVSYKWRYEITGNTDEDEIIFATPDPIGFACANLASIIREATAQYRFDEFHKHAGKIIREAVFGFENTKKKATRDKLVFAENGLQIIAIDLERVEPLDEQIANDLQAAIKTNINIQLDRAKAAAQAEAGLSAIENERTKNEAEKRMRMEAEEARAELIILEAANEKLKAEKSMETKVLIRSQESQAEAKAMDLVSEVEMKKLEQVSKILGPENAAAIETAKAASAKLSNAEKVFVPHDMTLHLHE